MRKLVEHILNKNYDSANKVLAESFRDILEQKMVEMKKMCGAKMQVQEGGLLDTVKKVIRLVSPTERANKSHKPKMKNIDGRELGKRKVFGENSHEDNIKKVLDVADELKNMAKKPVDKKLPNVNDLPDNLKQFSTKDLKEAEQLDEEPRVAIVKARIRGGKIQRRKKVSNVPGMTFRGGQLTRMSSAERRRRKFGAKKAARKAKAKRSQTLRKRKISLMKRKRLGL